ncbi:thiamine pyrophosphate-binding protein, partial [Bacillus subtilis]
MAHKTAGQAMTELLEQWGVDHVYGIPGDSINEFIEELRHERNQL